MIILLSKEKKKENDIYRACQKLSLFSMDQSPISPMRHTRSRYNNVIRESDCHADPKYKEKKEFFDQLYLKGIKIYLHHYNLVVQMNCNVLKENAIKEAKSIRDNLSLLISQLPTRVQNMKVGRNIQDIIVGF